TINIKIQFLVSSICSINSMTCTRIFTLSLHDALPIFQCDGVVKLGMLVGNLAQLPACYLLGIIVQCRQHYGSNGIRPKLQIYIRSEEHTSELQSRENLVCRLLLEKKKYLMIRKNVSNG